MNESVLYQNTLDTLPSTQLKALVDIAEVWAHFYDLDASIIFPLQDQRLLHDHWQRIGIAASLNCEFLEVDPLTAYGRAFVTWYLRPRAIPAQLELWA